MTTELEQQLAAERERADYAWRNTNTIEKARQDEMAKRDAAEREVALLREALEPFADIRFSDVLERCLLFHKWGKWRDIARGDVKVDGNFRGWYIRQERRCNRCGKVQLRDATTL